jgi:Zn-dependent M16 (insulinase) family peptidase
MAESVFTVSIRGTKRGRGKAFYDYVINALKEYIKEGIPAETIESSLKQMEFHLREKKSGSPMGLRLLNRSLRGWINGRKPWETCVYEENLSRLKKGALQKGYYEGLIRKWLIDNPHVSIVTVYADKKQLVKDGKKEKEFLKTEYEKLGKQGLENVSKDLEKLRSFQEKEDDPMDLAKIPSLGLADLPSKVRNIPTTIGETGSVLHALFSNQIVYVDLAFDISAIDEQQAFYLPLLASAITGCGLPGRSWDKILEDLNLVTGGFTAFADASVTPDGGCREYFYVRIKALEQDTQKALDLCLRLLLEGDLDDAKRMKQILIEMRNDQKSSILPQGHSYAGTRASAVFSRATGREEFWYGMAQLEFLNRLLDDTGKNPGLLCGRLKDLRSGILCSDNVMINVTADPARIGHWEKEIKTAMNRLPKMQGKKSADKLPVLGQTGIASREWFSVSSDVGYGALCVPSFNLLNPKAAHQTLLAHILKTGYLWQTVRMKNGAYGAFAAGSSLEGLFSWSSYRDPNPDLSMESFVESLDAFRSMELTHDQLLNSLVGVVGSEEKPGSASSDGFLGFRRHLYGITDAMRQTMRDWLFASIKEDLDAVCLDLKAAMSKSCAVLICGAKSASRIARKDSAWKVKPLKWLH